MSARLCPVDGCSRPAHPDWTICGVCAFDTEKALGDVPALAEQLDISLARQGANGARNGSRSSEKPLPFDLKASEALYLLRNTLVGWVRDLAGNEGLHARWYPDDTLPAMSAWLLMRRMRLIAHPAADQAVGEILFAVGQCWRVVDRAAERVYVGRCGGEEGRCDEELYVRAGRDRITCRSCSAVVEVESRREQMRAMLDEMLLTPAQIAGFAVYFGEAMDRERVRKLVNLWIHRKIIVPHGLNLRGQETYLFGEVMARLLASRGRSAG